ncbi:MarR family transcriptional regulator [Pseudonocardia sp. TRM90224]|uniref:MarR family transcriptional regulator n=1 Tax=Pseudonocardia sp. TRM90224 TaxID=2812678 RepID=UPI001E448702|nr:MarR family transcriptional regulator [Pseudonocardia sp. TRM90224]
MNGVELFLLGRTLMRLGEAAMPQVEGAPAGSTRSVLIVLSDIVEHPDSAVGDIVRRTGLPQSQVSNAVARLRDAGSVVVEPDPADRRRVRVRQAPTVSARVAEVRTTSVDEVIAAAVGPARLSDVLAAIDLLGAQLPPGH